MWDRVSSCWALAGVGCIVALWIGDVVYEVLVGGVVTPQIIHSAAARGVGEVAKEAGAAVSFRQAFDFLGSYLSRHAHTIAYGTSYCARDMAVSTKVSWRTADGGTLELVFYSDDEDDSTFVGTALIIPGLGGDARGSGLAVESCREACLRPVVLHRRGDGVKLTSARFNLFGDTRDLDDAVSRVRRRWPDVPLALFSSSAGTGLSVRYLGERRDECPVVAAFCNCPGYDISVALTRCAWIYDAGFYLSRLKHHYLERNKPVLLEDDGMREAYDRAASATSVHGFMAASSPFAGFDTFGEYLGASNPMGCAHDISKPILVINADDDPVCTRHNLDDHIGLFHHSKVAVLVRTSRGGHCGFFARRSGDFSLVYPWAHTVGARFLAAYCAREASLRAKAKALSSFSYN